MALVDHVVSLAYSPPVLLPLMSPSILQVGACPFAWSSSAAKNSNVKLLISMRMESFTKDLFDGLKSIIVRLRISHNRLPYNYSGAEILLRSARHDSMVVSQFSRFDSRLLYFLILNVHKLNFMVDRLQIRNFSIIAH